MDARNEDLFLVDGCRPMHIGRWSPDQRRVTVLDRPDSGLLPTEFTSMTENRHCPAESGPRLTDVTDPDTVAVPTRTLSR